MTEHWDDYYRPDAPAQPPARQQNPPARTAAEWARADPAYASLAPQHGFARVYLTGAEKFWYVLGNVAFAAMYMCKVPVKKALADIGEAEMTAAEQFWYVLMCICFGAGYFAKVPIKKALAESRAASR